MAKISYDEEEDILFLSKQRKVKASIEIGDFIIDIDKDNYVSGIEILDASKNLNIKNNLLKDIKEARMIVNYKPNYVYISLLVLFKNVEKNVAIPLTLDLGHGKVSKEQTIFAG